MVILVIHNPNQAFFFRFPLYLVL